MTRKFTKKFKNFYKVGMFGLALIMCLPFIPFNAVESLAATVTTGSSDLNTIVIEASPSKTVKIGQTYAVPLAFFKKRSASAQMIGDTSIIGTSNVASNSSVKVYYKNLENDTEEIFKQDADGNIITNTAKKIYGGFKPTRVGTYVISYSVTDTDGKIYSYDIEVDCENSDAYFTFSSLDDGLIPSYYDLGLLEKKNLEKDIVLPLPTVYNEENKPAKDGDNPIQFFIDDDNGTAGGNAIASSANNYVTIKVSGGTEAGAKIEKDGDNYVITYNTLKNVSKVGNYTVTYSYYEDRQFVVSTEKTFQVVNNHYKNDKDEPGYTLRSSWDSSTFSTAVTGVETKLPKVKGVTSANDKPASEAVPVSYEIKIEHRVNGAYVDVTKEKKDDDGKIERAACLVYNEEEENYYFKPYADGDYVITYTVTDFYGNTADKAETFFNVDGVKDQKLPTVFAYDANPEAEKDADGNPVSAKNKLVSTTNNKNMIVYGIGATDNAENVADMRLTRIIRDAGSTVRVETDDYRDYNLIFNYTNAAEFLADNFAVKRDMMNDTKHDPAVNIADEASVRTWLKEHHYLIVTNDYINNKLAGDDVKFDYPANVVTNPKLENGEVNPAFKLDVIKDELVKQGFAYINYNYSFTAQTYRIVYEARDKYAVSINDKAQLIYDMAVKDGTADFDAVPTINGPKDLQSTYLPTDKISFSEPSATVSNDDNMEVIKVYRVLGADRQTVLDVDNGITLDFDPSKETWESANTSNGWKVLKLKKSEENYTIDLNAITKEMPTANYIELMIYAINDHGKIGKWTKIMTIAQSNDDDTPEISKYVKPDLPTLEGGGTGYKQGDIVKLPTVYFSDKQVDYMSAEVIVKYLGKDGDYGQEGKQAPQIMASSDINAYADSYRGLYIVNAGNFVASFGGHYQVTVAAKDGAGHSVATYFDYEVKSYSKVERPVINNISSETLTLEVGEQKYLPSPTLAISDSTEYGYIGYDETDSAKTATYYTVKTLTAETSNFTLEKFRFVARSTGRYTLQYNVYLIQYKNDGTVTVEGGKLKTSTGKLIYVESDYDAAGNALEEPILAVEDGTTVPAGVELISIPSKIQTINVKDTGKPEITVNLDHIEPSYPAIDKDHPRSITIPKISAVDKSAEGINPAKSYVNISISKASNSTSINVTMDKWDESSYVTDGVFTLPLTENAEYTIRYHVEDYAKNSSELTKTFKNGDNINPEIKVEDGFFTKNKDEYRIGDMLGLRVDRDHLILSDVGGSTTVDELWESLEITLKNNDTDKVVANNGEVKPSEGKFAYSFNITEAGNYTLTIKVKDKAGWPATETISFTVKADENKSVAVSQIVGTILTVVSAVILAGVIVYFIVAKVQSSKKNKAISSDKKTK